MGFWILNREPLQITDGVKERDPADDHHEVDGVEVLRTPKATCEVRPRVGGGVELPAQRAKKTKMSVTDLPGKIEVTDQFVDRDLVSQPPEHGWWNAAHGRSGHALARLRRGAGRRGDRG